MTIKTLNKELKKCYCEVISEAEDLYWWIMQYSQGEYEFMASTIAQGIQLSIEKAIGEATDLQTLGYEIVWVSSYYSSVVRGLNTDYLCNHIRESLKRIISKVSHLLEKIRFYIREGV